MAGFFFSPTWSRSHVQSFSPARNFCLASSGASRATFMAIWTYRMVMPERAAICLPSRLCAAARRLNSSPHSRLESPACWEFSTTAAISTSRSEPVSRAQRMRRSASHWPRSISRPQARQRRSPKARACRPSSPAGRTCGGCFSPSCSRVSARASISSPVRPEKVRALCAATRIWSWRRATTPSGSSPSRPCSARPMARSCSIPASVSAKPSTRPAASMAFIVFCRLDLSRPMASASAESVAGGDLWRLSARITGAFCTASRSSWAIGPIPSEAWRRSGARATGRPSRGRTGRRTARRGGR
jgi:hypothetical protein